MRLARAFSSSTCRARQAFFSTPDEKGSSKRKAFLAARKRTAPNVNAWLVRDGKIIRSIFHCQTNELDRLRSECARRIEAALATLQDPASFQVKDLTFEKIMQVPTIRYPSELALIDLQNPSGIPPDTPPKAIPPIHNPSLVAKALSKAGFTGTFLHNDQRFGVKSNEKRLTGQPFGVKSDGKQPWPHYTHIPYGGFIYPPRLHIDADSKLGGAVTLTLPGATVQPLYNFFQWFHKSNEEFQVMHELVTIWARSHNIGLSPQATALMVISTMQSENGSFIDGLFGGGWADVEYRRDTISNWSRMVSSVDINFIEVQPLPPALVPVQFAHFFRHWRNRLAESRSYAFSVRQGRDNQLIPREYPFVKLNQTQANGYRFPKANITDPVRNFPPWSHERLVIQDPFLVTHNHAASLSKQMVVELQGQIHQTNRFLIEGRPLCSMYGTHATPPGSDAEAKILAKPQAYSAALGLLEQDRVPAAYRMEVAFANNPEIRDHISPDPRGPTWGSRRWFHASSVSPGRKKPFKNRMTPPKPIKEQDPAEYQEAWGLNSPVHKPSFWRPAPVREPLTLPTNSSAMHPVMHVPATEATNLVPPVRATKAGIAYKSMLSRRQGFHTTAYCAARGARAPPPEDSETQPSLAIDASVLASRNQTLFAVQDAIQKGFGQEYKVEIFGSTRYGVSSANSDLDMVVLDPYQPYGAAPGYEWDPARKMGSIYDMGKVAKKLRKAGFWIFETLPTASVPIVKFTDRNTGHDVDLNINDRLGVLNSDLIKRYCELNPVLIPMIRYIKLWAKPLGLNSPGRKARNMPVTFSSYALSMLTIGFLQYRGLLPNLQADLPPLEPGKLMGTFWLRKPRIMCCDVRYSMGHGWTPPEDPPVHQLMQEWFQFYGQDFNYKDEMISIRQGGRIPRPPRVPDRVSETFTGVFWNIDPFIRSKNITQNIARFTLSRFVKLCGEMASKEEFRRGVLPRLPPPRARQEKQIGGGLDDLMPPAEMRRAEFTWVPKDGFPSAWTKNKLNTMKKRKLSQAEQRKQAERAQRVPPPDPDANWVPFEDAVPFGWNNAQQTSTAPANTPEKASPVDEGVREEGAPPPPDTSKLDYDPTLRFDEFGRYMAPKPRRKVEPEEPEEDQIGFGLR